MTSESPAAPNTFVITDFVTNINELSDFTLTKEEPPPTTPWGKCLRVFSILNPAVWVVLTLLGMLTAILGFVADYVGEKLLESRAIFAFSDLGPPSLILWLGYSLFFALIAAGCGLWISPEAEGSGIPEMKSILSGVRMPKYLSLTTLFAKVIGLIAAYSSGLSIGREGPFVHLAGCIANNLCKMRGFRHVFMVSLMQNQTMRNQILAASVAAGIAATFGAPIGGVLFSIEVTSTYYVVNNLWKAFFCSVWCCLMFMVLKSNALADLLTNAQFSQFEFDWEVVLFALLGVLCGAVGAVFVQVTHRLIYIRKHALISFTTHRFRYTLSVASLCALITYQATFLRQPDKDILKSLFQDTPSTAPALFEEPNTGFNLLIYTLCKLMMTAVSYSTPVPCGIFIPTFTGGAALGRLYGYLVDCVWKTTHLGVYSVIGAAALTSSVTHTISVAVIVFELTGDMHYMLAMLIAVLLSFSVGTALSASIYDYLLDMKKLPYLPTLKSSHMYSLKAVDLVNPDQPLQFLLRNSTLQQLAQHLENGLSAMLHKIPIVDEEMHILGDVAVVSLRKYLLVKYLRKSKTFSQSAKERLDEYFERLYFYQERKQCEIDADAVQLRGFELCDDDFESLDPRVEDFWNHPIEWNSELISLDEAPLSISDRTPLGKVHFMFMMLGVPQLYITKKGALIGYITKESFSKHGV